MEGIEIKEFNDITTAEDGSVCVKIQPNTIPSGRYYYHVTLKREDGTIIATIKNEMEVIMVNDDCCPHNDMCGDEECDSRITPFFAVASDCCPHNDMCGDEECDSRITPFFAVARALQGEDGVGISGIELRNNHLYVTLTNARVIDAGEIDVVSEEDLQDIVAMAKANTLAIVQLEAATINGMTLVDEEGSAKNVVLTAANINMGGDGLVVPANSTLLSVVTSNFSEIATLKGDADTVGSVDYKIANAFKWVEVTA